MQTRLIAAAVCLVAIGCGGALTAGALFGIDASKDDSDDPLDRAPEVTVDTPSGVINDIVTITYRLTDADDGDRANVRVEYSTGSGFKTASQAFVEGAEGVENLTTSTTGETHTFFWNTSQDLGQGNVGNVTIRITPIAASNTSLEGVSVTTNPFTVSNEFITTLARRPVQTAVRPLCITFTPGTGDIILVDGPGNRVLRIERATGDVSLVAGTGESGFNGSGIPGNTALLNFPRAASTTPAGDVLITDTNNALLRCVDGTTGFITIIAGGGGNPGEAEGTTIGVLGKDAFVFPLDVAVDSLGNPFFAEVSRVRALNLQQALDLTFPLGSNPCTQFTNPIPLGPSRVLTIVANDDTCGGAPSAFSRSQFFEVAAIAAFESGAEKLLYVLDIGDGGTAGYPRIEVVNLSTTQNLNLTSAVTTLPIVVPCGDIAVVAADPLLPEVGEFTDMTVMQGGRVLLLTSDELNRVFAVNLSNATVTVAGTPVPSGTGLSVIGSGNFGLIGDGDAPANADLALPVGIGVDSSGNIFVGEGIGRLRVVANQNFTIGNLTIAAGTVGTLDTTPPDSKPALVKPEGLVVTPAGDLLVTDSEPGDPRSNRLFQVSSLDPVPKSIVGTGVFGDLGDGGPAADARIGVQGQCAVSADGNIILLTDMVHPRVRAVNTSSAAQTFLGVTIGPNAIQTVVGTGKPTVASVTSDVGDGGPPNQATLDTPQTVAFDAVGLVWIADSKNHRVRVANPTSSAVTVAGVTVPANGIRTVVGAAGDQGSPMDDGDGGPASGAKLNTPSAFITPDGCLFILDGLSRQNTLPRVRVVNLQASAVTVAGVSIAPGAINTIAGSGQQRLPDNSNLGDDGPALQATFRRLSAISLRSDGLLFLSDTDDHRIRAVNTSSVPRVVGGVTIAPGAITTVVGTGIPAFDGDPSNVARGLFGVATPGPIDSPKAIHAYEDGRLLFTDSGNGSVRMANLSEGQARFGGVEAGKGRMVVVAGSRSGSVRVSEPVDVRVDAQGIVVFSDQGNLGDSPAILQLDPQTRVVTRLAGNLEETEDPTSDLGDGGIALLATFDAPTGLHLDGEGSVYIADTGNTRIRFVNRANGDRTPMFGVTVSPGNIDTVLGGAGDGFPGNDDGLTVGDPRLDLFGPTSVSEAGGMLWVVDEAFGRVMRVNTASGVVSGILNQGEMILGPVTTGQLSDMVPGGNQTFGDATADFFTDGGGIVPGDTLRFTAITLPATQIFEDTANITGSLPGLTTVIDIQSAQQLTMSNNFAMDNMMNVTWEIQRNFLPTSVSAISATQAYVAFQVPIGQLGGGVVFRVTRSGGVWAFEHIAGSGYSDWNGDHQVARSMAMGRIRGIVQDGNLLYLADSDSSRVVAVNVGGTTETVAGLDIAGGEARMICGGGQGEGGFNGDAVPANVALLNFPTGVAVSPDGGIVVVDSGNGSLRRFQK